MISPANLVVQPFSVAANAVAGQNLTVTYEVDNESSNGFTGTWTDSVYLSTQTTLNANSVLLGRVQQDGVAANGQYSQTVTAPVPGLLPDDYYVVVLADSQGLVPELNRTSTELASTIPVQITVPPLTVGSPISGTIASSQSLYYQVTLSAGQDVAISAGFNALQGGELYVSYQSIPSTSANLTSSTSPTQTTQQVVIPDTQAGDYYVLLTGDAGSGSGEPFTLSATALPLQISSVGPSQAGNSGTTTLTIQGAEFTAGTTVSLVPRGGGTAIAASDVMFQSSTTLFAQFNLAGAAAGAYDVDVTSGGQEATDPSAFTVTSSTTPGQITYNLSVPSISRPGRIAYLTLTYANDGGSDAPAPLFVVAVTSGNATIGLPGQTNFSGSSVQILGIENTGPAGTLPPGFQGTLEIPYESTTLTQGAEINFSLQVLTGDSTPMNWSSLESSLQPSYIPNAAWPAVFANLTAEFGTTTASYLAYLDSEATYLSQLGEYTDDVQRLFGFAINTANNALTTGSIDSVTDASFPVPGAIPLDFVRQFNASISGRDTMGPFGYGWTDNWQMSVSADSSRKCHDQRRRLALVFRHQLRRQLHAGARRVRHAYAGQRCLPVRRDRWHDHRLQHQRFARLRGRHQRQSSHVRLQRKRRADKPDCFQRLGDHDRLQRAGADQLDHRTRQPDDDVHLRFERPAPAHVHRRVRHDDLRLRDRPDRGRCQCPDIAHFCRWHRHRVVVRRRGPAGDARGGSTVPGRTPKSRPTHYPAPGEFTITDADGDTTAYFNDDQGNLGETIDALGNITRYAYDANDDLIKVVAADGTTTTYSYDANGNMISETDPLGYTISFTYNQFAEPLTFVNQEGYTTSYQYDANGNLLEHTNPDGTTQQYVYNSSRRGDLLDRCRWRHHHLRVQHQRPTDHREPARRHVEYLHLRRPRQHADRRRPRRGLVVYLQQPKPADDDRRAVRHADCAVRHRRQCHADRRSDRVHGRLRVRRGRPAQRADRRQRQPDRVVFATTRPATSISETKGNGTSTTYQYNADGDITEITNLAPGGAINSQMTYAYNAVGEVTSMTTGGVTTTYGYDADGELTSASRRRATRSFTPMIPTATGPRSPTTAS